MLIVAHDDPGAVHAPLPNSDQPLCDSRYEQGYGRKPLITGDQSKVTCAVCRGSIHQATMDEQFGYVRGKDSDAKPPNEKQLAAREAQLEIGRVKGRKAAREMVAQRTQGLRAAGEDEDLDQAAVVAGLRKHAGVDPENATVEQVAAYVKHVREHGRPQ